MWTGLGRMSTVDSYVVSDGCYCSWAMFKIIKTGNNRKLINIGMTPSKKTHTPKIAIYQ